MIKPLSISTKSTSSPQVALRTWSKPHQWPRRAQFAGVSTTLFLLLLLYISHNHDGKSGYQLPALLSSNPRCPNDRWSNGRWVQRDPPHLKMASSADVYKVSGFTGCSMTKENWIHLSHENMTQWSWRSRISTYDWTPGRGCDVAAFDKKEFILRMLKKGGWLMVGDETTEQQFISLSCLLHPYVRAGPFFARHGGWKKSWPEFLYLNLQDKWIQSLLEKQMPLGFNPAFTPIISYTRADLLFSKPELADVGAWTSHPTADPSKFWGPGDIFTQSALDWLDAFEAKFPGGRYATLILSSGTYWTPAVFKGLGGDAANVLRLWRVAMNLLAARMVAMLDADKTKTRVVIFRSAVQGHENCTEPANRDMEPLTTYRELKHNLYNWPALPLMNDVLETIVKTHNHPRMHFLRVERPAQLRVDAHPVGDCSRYVVGAGILEDWNIYMNHYELWEVDRSR